MLPLYFIVILSVSAISDACMCMPSHPQEGICKNNSFVALVKIKSENYVKITESPTLLRRRKSVEFISVITREVVIEEEASGFVPTASSNEVITDDREADYMRYKIKIYKVYKGIDAKVNHKEKFYIYTLTDEGICGRKFTVGETYLVIGSVVDGRLMVSLCDHVIEWKSMPKMEKHNIRANMGLATSSCEAGCRVKSCMWSECASQETTECVWNRGMESNYGRSFNRANFLCVPGFNKECEWSGLGVATEKRLTRRRRHYKLRHSKRHSSTRRSSTRKDFDLAP